MRNFASRARRQSVAGIVGTVLLVATAAAVGAGAPVIAPEKTEWKPSSVFEKDTNDELRDQPRMNLSGAACVPTTPKFTSCLIANDEKKYAQFFSITGTMLAPLKLIRLSDADKDPDAEGVAYADGFFYVTGSHGRSRNTDKANESSYAVFRFPVNPVTGIPPFEVTEQTVAAEIKSSTRLGDEISKACVVNDQPPDDCSIKNAHNKKLNDGGANIEGIAVRGGRMHFGFRGPSQDGNAYVLSVDADAMFKDTDLKSKAISLPLGKDVGIRDLAAISDGILVLAGPTRGETVPYAVWLWDGVGNNVRKLATLDLDGIEKGGKAEILLPLEESSANIRALVVFDGIENGGAVSFKIPR